MEKSKEEKEARSNEEKEKGNNIRQERSKEEQEGARSNYCHDLGPYSRIFVDRLKDFCISGDILSFRRRDRNYVDATTLLTTPPNDVNDDTRRSSRKRRRRH